MATLPHHRTDCTVSCHVNTVQTVRTVQSTKFCLFGKMDRTRYLTHMISFEPVQVALGS
jgi:hypothetical protein